MDAWIRNILGGLPLALLLAAIAALLLILGKGADWLVEEAVTLSLRWGVPKMLIGATIVSLGTTTPEVTISVLAAIRGEPGLALGNTVGSIICNTGLILGTAALISPLPLPRRIIRRQGLLKLATALLLIASCLPYRTITAVFSAGGRLPRVMGFVFLGLLAAYLWQSRRWALEGEGDPLMAGMAKIEVEPEAAPLGRVLLKLAAAISLVIGSSRLLIPTVNETAVRFRVPEGIIAATLVAFGTSVPELVTAVTAARKGHGDLAVGNVVGADILNVLLVAGAAAAVTPGGLAVAPYFFRIHLPAMLVILTTFAVAVLGRRRTLRRPFGLLLLALYLGYLAVSYSVGLLDG